ncbi:MAG: hypothetical protein K6T86_08875 [Pirellulales bacterium]|nr:hypothetical protein [Pirellulales bacterium]
MPASLAALLRLAPDAVTAPQAARLASALGGLAAWWLQPRLLQRACEYLEQTWPQSPLPATRGACYAVMANPGWPCLQEAVVWPLEWRETPGHDPRLSSKLLAMADDILARMGRNGWGLHQHPQFELREGVLQELNATADFASAWAALAAGLETAAANGTPDPAVWATGCWDAQRGIAEVDGLAVKLRLAVRQGATAFFVPEPQCDTARALLAQSQAAGLEVHPLTTGTLEPRGALRKLLQRVRAQPASPRDAQDQRAFEECVQYYLSQPLDDRRTQEFYETHLLPTITVRLQVTIRQTWPDWRPTHLVTIVSRRQELVWLAARALGVRCVLLLHTPDQHNVAQEVQHRLHQHGTTSELAEFPNDLAMQDVLCKHLQQFARNVQPPHLVMDTTPGSKLMSLSLNAAAPAGSWLFYLWHQTGGSDHRPLPGSEQPLRWQVRG